MRGLRSCRAKTAGQQRQVAAAHKAARQQKQQRGARQRQLEGPCDAARQRYRPLPQQHRGIDHKAAQRQHQAQRAQAGLFTGEENGREQQTGVRDAQRQRVDRQHRDGRKLKAGKKKKVGKKALFHTGSSFL